MGEAVKIIENKKQLECLESSLIIQSALRQIGQFGIITLVDCIENPHSYKGISALLFDEGNNIAYGNIADPENQTKLRFSLKYNPKNTSQKIASEKELINRRLSAKEEIPILLPFRYSQPLKPTNHKSRVANDFSEISSTTEFLMMVDMLEDAKVLKNLTIDEELFSTRIYAPNKSGFFGISYHQFTKEFEGFMINRKYSHSGIRFRGKVNNLHQGMILKNCLEMYKIIANK